MDNSPLENANLIDLRACESSSYVNKPKSSASSLVSVFKSFSDSKSFKFMLQVTSSLEA